MRTSFAKNLLLTLLTLVVCLPEAKAGEPCCLLLFSSQDNNEGISFSAPTIGWVIPEKAGDKKFQRIDTHIHLYDTGRPESATFLDSVRHKKIYFPHLAAEFTETAGPAGVGFAIVVEASKRREDNFWLMQQVDASKRLLAFIGNLDPRDAWFAEDLDLLAKSSKFRGIRIRPKTPINLADPAVVERLSELDKRKLVLELGINGIDPALVAAIAHRYPDLHVVIDHLAGGKMFIDLKEQEKWKEQLAILASEPNVYCKISALFDLSGQQPAPLNSGYYDPMIDPVVKAFGPERVMFGSNWTLSELFGSYKDMVNMLDDYCKRRKNIIPEQFYFENAKRVYGIK
jgi:predicted TIM-barrel fold metal-dependent hydrolase